MKSMIIVALALVAIAVAYPAKDEEAQIKSQNFDQKPNGEFAAGFETSNGISQQQLGTLKEGLNEENKPVQFLTLRGSYSYENSEGKIETINYFADETGYHAEGASIPQVAQQ